MHVIERGSGTPIVLLHGFGVDHRILLPLDPVIDAAGPWRRLFIDLPGHGETEAGEVASTADVVEAVLAEIDRRLGAEPFAIVGNSFGGMIARAVAHALRPQVLGLGTMAGVFVSDPALRDLPERVVLAEDPAVLAGLDEEIAAEYAGIAVEQTREGARMFAESVMPGARAADAAALDRIAELYTLETEPEDLSPAPFTQPALFVTGRQDHVTGFRDVWSRLDHYPRATFAVLDAAGHNTHLDRPGPVAALLRDWLERMR